MKRNASRSSRTARHTSHSRHIVSQTLNVAADRSRSKPILATRGVMLLSLLLIPPWHKTAAAQSEQWFLITLDQKPVGYEQIKIDPIVVRNENLVACYRKTHIQMHRLGKKLNLTAATWTQQTIDGQLRSIRIQRSDAAGHQVERSGEWNSRRQSFEITERVAGTLKTFDLPTRHAPRSPIESTWIKHLLSGSRSSATAHIFFPETSEIVAMSTSKRNHRSLRVGERRLDNVTEYRFVQQLDPARSTRIFADAEDRILRSETVFLGGVLAIESSTAADALKAARGDTLNIDVLAIVPVNRPLSASQTISETEIELKLKNGLLPLLPTTPWQQIEPVDAATTRITLLRPKRSVPQNVSASFSPSSAELTASRWMPLDDPELRRMAQSSVSGLTEPMEICLNLEDLVRRKLRHSAFSTALQPAPKIARTLRGDCTEHAVLLAALIRTAGIPARVAGGLVYSNRQLGFSGHAWVEALVNDTWVPFDSAIPSQSRAVHHIKLTHSLLNDDDDTGISLFLPLLDLAGQATITVISEK